MLDQPTIDSGSMLIEHRKQVLNLDLEDLSQRYGDLPSKRLAEVVAQVAAEQKPALSLLLAQVTLRQAAAGANYSQMHHFLHRFASHLKYCADGDAIPISQKATLLHAARKSLTATVNPPQRLYQAIESMTSQFHESNSAETDWTTQLGVSSEEYAQQVRFLATKPSERRDDQIPLRRPTNLEHHNFNAPRIETPAWLSFPVEPPWDSSIMATANWNPGVKRASTSADHGAAWASFVRGDVETAHALLGGLYTGIGLTWGPNSTTNSLRSWHWLRLVEELSRLNNSKSADRRRSSTTAFELAYRCLSQDDEILERLVADALDDFRASDPTSVRAWCAYTVRLIACCGHEHALENYNNSDKAQLRKAWAEYFKKGTSGLSNTAAMSAALADQFRAASHQLYVRTRDETKPHWALRSSAHALSPFLDEAEAVLLSDTTDLIVEATTRIEDGDLNHNELMEHQTALSTMQAKIATSSSLPLQDYVAPLINKFNFSIEEAKERLGNISRPDVSIRLESARLPFSALSGTSYFIRTVVANSGNTAAENVSIVVTSDELGIRGTAHLENLGVSAEEVVEVAVKSTSQAPQAATLDFELSWSDAAMQTFNAKFSLAAEDQRPTAWTSSDINPYSLGFISDPSRLVGRDDDLAALEALIAGGGSAYITGHKRVGKTSLTRVLIERKVRDRGWTGSVFSLGRALGPEQLAEDLVYTLLEEIYISIQSAYGEILASIEEVQIDPKGNFARAANRWLRTVSRALPNNARIAIAIDDFDELPPNLVSGTQADNLFLFLRSIVDEPWLNLVIVGSEVLPTVIQGQAHKLNQVVPVWVTNFSSRASTAALLETPTVKQLEWDPKAIDRVHHVCRGNPYYETLVAHELWDKLREQSRSFATVGDVDHAAETVAKGAPASHFVHLWADSTAGVDHTSRRAIVTSAVLRAVARCGGSRIEPAQIDEVINVSQSWVQTATANEIQEVISSLLDRRVIEKGPVESSVLISIPLVAIWLTYAGARELDREYAKSMHAIETVKLVTDSDLVGLSRGLAYRGEAISEIRIRDWLQQFGDNYHQFLAFKLLSRMVKDGYFTTSRLQETVMPRLRQAVSNSQTAHLLARDNNGYAQNGYLIDHGKSGDSTQGTLSWLCKTLKIKKANILSPDQIVPGKVRLRDPGAILFILDDFCGSGEHLRDCLSEVFEYLPALGDSWREDVHIVVGAGVVSNSGRLPSFQDSGISIEHVSGLELGARFRPFNLDSGVFETEQERRDAEDLITTIGRALTPNNPLGFGGDALLALLEFNCPNNAPPVFWKKGRYAGRTWYPLFERVF